MPDHLIRLQGKVFDEESTTKRTYIRTYTPPNPDLDRFAVELFAWTNDIVQPPEWVIDPEGMPSSTNVDREMTSCGYFKGTLLMDMK